MHRYSSYQSPSSTPVSNDDMSVVDAPTLTKSRTPLYVGLIGVSTMILLILALSMSNHSPQYSLTSFTQRGNGNGNGNGNPKDVCENPKYSKTTLKLAQEMSAIALFKDLKGQKKFEASSIIHVGQYFYIAFDNLWSLGRVHEQLPFHSEENILIGPPGIDSGFEALVYDQITETFYIVIETRPHIDKKRVEANMNTSNEALTVTGREEQFQGIDEQDPDAPKYHAVIQEVRLSSGLRGVTAATQEYEVIRSCDTEKEFTSGNKGIEGAAHVNKDGKLYILGLCEGNFCSGGRKGKTSGNGRIVVMTADYDVKDNPNGCEWKTQKEIHLPKEIDFVDYSALTLRKTNDPNVYRMAVATQEGAQVWIGKLNIDTWEVESGKLYNFPRNDNCDIIFCNVEGLHWLGDDMFVAVSDKMKSGGKQPFHCLPHDQSVHIFVLP